jgi:PIN domain nuclease of toxin-antitoxin system
MLNRVCVAVVMLRLGRPRLMIETNELAISDIVLWELSKLVQLKRLELDLNSANLRSLLLNLQKKSRLLNKARLKSQI